MPIRAQSGPVSGDGRQFIPDEADYDDLREVSHLDCTPNDLKWIDFRRGTIRSHLD